MSDRRAELPSHAPDAAPRAAPAIDRLLHEIDALIDADETADRQITGALKTFADVTAAAHAHAWDAYSVDLSVDAASYRLLDRRRRNALLRLFATIYRAEAVVDDWMNPIVAAVPTTPDGRDGTMGYDALRTALAGQEHDERMHRSSLLRVAAEVLGIPPGEVDRVTRKHDNFVAETLFARFNRTMAQLLRPGRPLADLYTAIFVYGIISEDVVANSDVVIRRAKTNDKYDEFNLPGMKEGQTNVRRDEGRHVRIAVLATHKYLDEHEGAAVTLIRVAREYMDLADALLKEAKQSHGLIDAHLQASYGPGVDSLYYYTMNMKRLAVRLDELGLREGVLDVKHRVDRAVAELTDERRTPIVEAPGPVFRTLGPTFLRLAHQARSRGTAGP